MTRIGARPAIGNERGSTLVEFALLLPVLLTLMMGFGELSYQGYVKSVLVGAVQKAGRDAAIEGAGAEDESDAIDNKVRGLVQTVAKNATVTFDRKSYPTFGTVNSEYFRDINSNDQFDAATECYIDTNGNGQWDASLATEGQGGANDITVYTVRVSYPRLFPGTSLFRMSPTANLVASTTLKNQPYEDQQDYSTTEVCP